MEISHRCGCEPPLPMGSVDGASAAPIAPIVGQRPWLAQGPSVAVSACPLWQSAITVLFGETLQGPLSCLQPLVLAAVPVCPHVPAHAAFSPHTCSPPPGLSLSGCPQGFHVSCHGDQRCTEVCRCCQLHACRVSGSPGSFLEVQGTSQCPSGWLWQPWWLYLPQCWSFTMQDALLCSHRSYLCWRSPSPGDTGAGATPANPAWEQEGAQGQHCPAHEVPQHTGTSPTQHLHLSLRVSVVPGEI